MTNKIKLLQNDADLRSRIGKEAEKLASRLDRKRISHKWMEVISGHCKL